MTAPPADFPAFRSLSAKLGKDPLRVQGAGGNTSLKQDGVMWIKASGTELANADTTDIFVAVDLEAARGEADGGGDGSCKATVLDPTIGLRPSIETTFHAVLDRRVVAHTHSIATLVHAVSPQGLALLDEKLAGLPWALVPYAMPGLPLTREIMANATEDTQVFVLQNHGLICAGDTVEEVTNLIEAVEERLVMPSTDVPAADLVDAPPAGFSWAEEGWLAVDTLATDRVLNGTYYPDHVVFLGPALPEADSALNPPAILVKGHGVALRDDATPAQRAMLLCLSDLLRRVPHDWDLVAIGPEAEAELLDWDAEKYRQALAARS